MAVAWGIGLVILFVSSILGRLGGFVGANAGALVAAYFLLAPIVILRRRGMDPADLAIHADRPLRSLLLALAVAAVVFPPYALGYDFWARWTRDAPFRIPIHVLTDVPSSARGRPDLESAPQGLHAWVEDDERLVLLNTGEAGVPVRVRGCDPSVDRLARSGDHRLVLRGLMPGVGEVVEAPLAPGTGLRCSIASADSPSVEAADGAATILAGVASVDAGPRLDLARSSWWLLELLLVQFAGIALPEEVFYRGYAQGRLATVFRRRWRFLGADLGWHIPVASALFAVSHLVAIPAPFRLAVFFPGLLFGWLRERTGSVLAPAILHALSNVLLELMVRTH